jgi:hypothetical protein
MKKLLVLSVFLILAVPVLAQDTPKAEIFAGYQFNHVASGLNTNGFNASLTGNFNDWFGIAADFSGTYKGVAGRTLSVYTYTFGPVITARHAGQFQPYVHALAGGAHRSFAGSSSSTFAAFLGGGVDANLSNGMAWRLVQLDYEYTHFGGVGNSGVRASTGIVLRW